MSDTFLCAVFFTKNDVYMDTSYKNVIGSKQYVILQVSLRAHKTNIRIFEMHFNIKNPLTQRDMLLLSRVKVKINSSFIFVARHGCGSVNIKIYLQKIRTVVVEPRNEGLRRPC